MEALPAIVLSTEALEEMLERVGRRAAELVVAQLNADLREDPQDRQVKLLRCYLADRRSIEDPRAMWANSHHIRRIEVGSNGKPKSMTWLHRFKQESGLIDCVSRPSPTHGRLREWTFEDIANAWERYYMLKW
ncbi:hypothetical protein WNZ15_22455 [Roseibium sp. AS2]|uniref:hypothetical protein n=1 Tax=Roseibium sp. AS2 TaxID=3135781 RepID=UPI00317F9377